MIGGGGQILYRAMDSVSGRDLRKLRETKGITLDEAAAATRLRTSIIAALEGGAACDLLAPVYQELSLRTYARFLEEAAEKAPAKA